MTKQEANKIIKSYRPHKGFFDLSIKPKELSNIEYAKILKTQNLLAKMNEDREYMLKHKPAQWNRLKILSARLQHTIFSYWGDQVINQ